MDEHKLYGEVFERSLKVLIGEVKAGAKAIFRGGGERNPKDKIGLIFAIATHSEEERERLQVDLIRPLKQELASSSIGGVFNVIEAPQKDATAIDTPQKALGYLRRRRAHMMIYGDLVLRQDPDGEQNHVFRLHGAIRHAPIPKEASGRFGAHFREVLPELSGFPQKNEIGSFEVKKHEIAYVITYVMGVAAALSLDLRLSRTLFEETLAKLSQIKDVDAIQPFAMFYQLTRRRLAEVLSLYIKIAYARFVKSRDRDEILKTRKDLETMKELDPDNYPAHLSRAIFHFFSGQVPEAIAELEEIRNSEVTWRYSLGFLYAYTDQIDRALEQYKIAVRHPLADPAILFDIDIFMSEVIEKEPEKIQLLFFRGHVNNKQRGDKKLAKEDFEAFLSKSGGRYPRLEELATKYLSKIDN